MRLLVLAICLAAAAAGGAQPDRGLAQNQPPSWRQSEQPNVPWPDQGSWAYPTDPSPWIAPGWPGAEAPPFLGQPTRGGGPSSQAPIIPWDQAPGSSWPTNPDRPAGPVWGPRQFGPWSPDSPATQPRGMQPPYPIQPPAVPARPNWPGMTPGWQRPDPMPSGPRTQQPIPFQTAAWTPRLEWSLETRDPYLQQPVLLRLEVTSSDDPGTPNLELPTTDDALLKILSGPTSAIRFDQGQQRISQRFILSLTPLRTGDLTIPPLRIRGSLGFGQGYELATDPIRLQVRPPMPSVRPWLPLKSLTISARLDPEGPLTPGQPVSLALELKATGGTAIQLPTLEKQLTAANLRIYREQTLTDAKLSADGAELIATRIEYYTLVPQAAGRLTLPEISIAWWNTERGVREVARLPPLTLEARGGLVHQALTWLATATGKLWLPFALILLVLGSYWVGARYRGRLPALGGDLIRLTLGAISWGGGRIARWLKPLGRALDPALWVGWVHSLSLRLLPTEQRLIRHLRHAARARTPEDWYRRLAQAGLAEPGELTRSGLLARILNTRPQADPQALARLLSQLDAAVYGRAPLDFAQWKRDWRRQLRGGLKAPLGGRGQWLRRAGLPPLNPQVGL